MPPQDRCGFGLNADRSMTIGLIYLIHLIFIIFIRYIIYFICIIYIIIIIILFILFILFVFYILYSLYNLHIYFITQCNLLCINALEFSLNETEVDSRVIGNTLETKLLIKLQF